jgi:putative phosphoesterase
MRVAVVSDTHDRTAVLECALRMLPELGIDLVLHCGDIQSAETVRLFAGLPSHFVLGNWDGDWIPGVNCGLAPRAPDGRKRNASRLRRAIEAVGGTLHEPWGELELEGRAVAWVHGDDRALLRDLEHSGCYDYLFYGHTHAAERHRTGRTLVVNPGAMFKVHPMSFALLDTGTGEVESVLVS